MLQYFFHSGKLLGTAPRSILKLHDKLSRPCSELFYCFHCGEVYAKCPVVGGDGKPTQWVSYGGRCLACADIPHISNSVPGSLFPCYGDIPEASEAVLRHELTCQINHFLRNSQ